MISLTFTVLSCAEKKLKVECLSDKQPSTKALLILPEIWGVNLHIQEIAEQYLALGFDVFLPDIYWRQQEDVNLNYDESDTVIARKLYANLDLQQTSQDIDQVIDFIFKLNKNYKLAVLGFCMGGTLTYQLQHPKISAVIAYYGSQISKLLPAIQEIEKPILFHLAENDHLITKEEIASLDDLASSKANFQIYRYPNTGHGFNCPYRSHYSLQASEIAFKISRFFLIENMV